MFVAYARLRNLKNSQLNKEKLYLGSANTTGLHFTGLSLFNVKEFCTVSETEE